MLVLARLERQCGGIGETSAVPLFLASPVQGVQPRPVGPQAPGVPLRVRVESRVRGDTATTPPPPQTALVVRGSIWLEREIKPKLAGFPNFKRGDTELSGSRFSPSRSICGGMPFCRFNLLPKPPSTSSSSCWFSSPSCGSSSSSSSSTE